MEPKWFPSDRKEIEKDKVAAASSRPEKKIGLIKGKEKRAFANYQHGTGLLRNLFIEVNRLSGPRRLAERSPFMKD